MSLSDLVIDSETYKAYASLDEANKYLAVDTTGRGVAWAALSISGKSKNLVAATRRLDLMPWRGTPTGGAAQENAWPRSGLTYPNGDELADTVIPLSIEHACIILGGTIATTPAVSDAGVVNRPIRRVRAGSAEVEFSPEPAVQASPLRIGDETVQALIRHWIGGKAGAFGAAFGTDGESIFEGDSYRRTYGFN